MDLKLLLEILKEVTQIVQALRDMGIKMDGTIRLGELTSLIKKD